ncbi:MAG TPA: SDR family NAD(P)-dependent oxidoreductase [Acidimicrobiales bacterium]|nr:SDR family NAD(P)-dependent oxidoreductase [Acidimicrobiales bacterium]
MEELSGAAVVTGAASGIGKAMAMRFAEEGMSVVLADVEQGALVAAEADVAAAGGETMSVVTDVSDRASVDALAMKTIERFGPPTVLCNNAGVSGLSGGSGAIWDTTENDWQWVLGVNLMGVVHGIQAFLPSMIEAGRSAHVVNTSSILGLATGGGGHTYNVSKHAVTRLSEGLWYDLQERKLPIGVTVLCPGLIATNIITANRNRPEHLRNAGNPLDTDEAKMRIAAVDNFFKENGMRPEEVADIVVGAIREDRFYVLTHPELMARIEERFRSIFDGTHPPAPTTALNLLGSNQ